MHERPGGSSDATVTEAAAEGWGLRSRACSYVAVGFGGHHWRLLDEAGRAWFVTVDDLPARRERDGEPLDVVAARLAAALGTARALADGGHRFVVAPEPTVDGEVVHRLGERWAVSIMRWSEGQPGEWGAPRTPDERSQVLDLLVELHGVPPEVTPEVEVDDLAVEARGALERALAELDTPWTEGPLGEQARQLVRVRAPAGPRHRLFHRYDELVELAAARPERFVLTHGEPHPGNLITTDGGLRLVDWDTVRLAPPERDLWLLLEGDADDAELLRAYETATGRVVDHEALELFRLRWDLTDVALFTRRLHGPHEGGADDQAALAHLASALDRLAAAHPGG